MRYVCFIFGKRMLGSFSKYFDEAIVELTRFFLTNKEHHFFEAATEAQRNKFRLFAHADIKSGTIVYERSITKNKVIP
jgi:hypothetical protein